MTDPQDPLDHLLDRWGENTPEPSHVESEVWRRIAFADEQPSLAERVKTVFLRPSFSLAFAAACVLLGLFLVQLHVTRAEARHNRELVQSYLRLVDPLLPTKEVSTPGESAESLEAMLAWMKSDLQLTDGQLARIRAVHEQLSPHLLALASQVERMRRDFLEFEKERRSLGQIDFLEFARFVDQRRELDRDCNLSTRQLVAAASDVMTPRQREQYLHLLDPALRTPPGRSL